MKIKKRTKQKVSSKKVLLVCVRYILLLGIVFSLPFIYAILTQPTITPVVSLLKLMYSDVEVLENTISIDKTTFIEIIPACIAGSAYLLLIILNLSVPLSTKKRIYTLVFSLAVLFVVNVI
ncbi:MAG TPA: pacearchaeosortase, partial [Bacteroidia bacterium]|nr:pacearchaeosortase [Bacteroidia bacterium]